MRKAKLSSPAHSNVEVAWTHVVLYRMRTFAGFEIMNGVRCSPCAISMWKSTVGNTKCQVIKQCPCSTHGFLGALRSYWKPTGFD